eukprot:CAMPEP_0183745164 /NCGR_PEP_ID=MMETSP0737-20130205/66101_1 /TAXON_ID=385413 /ORGANISM="Thalassiosira miniscula, Strain CCMP1093" /LENGTH=537 /DNA_ID=CAMNT_0025980823 /DNA_START=107 /DNA_END=1721 /DNA_ORIENTATION=+
MTSGLWYAPVTRRSKKSTADDATVDTTTAVLQGTHNNEDGDVDDDASTTTFQRLRKFSKNVATAGSSTIMEEEESDDESESSSKARIVDFRRTTLICVSLVVIIAVVIGSSFSFAKPPPEFSTSTATPPQPLEDGLPHLHKYAYVFVAYDRSGYAVAHQLIEQLQKTMAEQKGHGQLTEQFIDPRGQFNTGTLCTDLNLESNTVTILEAPEFHCNWQKIRSLFMDHEDLKQEKYGVKVIHLVRNPFSMAVANYQDRKSYNMPEEVRFKNPCSSLTETLSLNSTMTVADLNSPILEENGIMTHEDFGNIWSQCNGMYQTQPGLETASYQQHLEKLPPAGGLRMAMADGVNNIEFAILEENGIMTHEDFDNTLANCNGMYQTQPGLETATYQQHLEQLPPADGLRMSVADGIKNIALMASDLITFKRVHQMVLDEHSNPKRKKKRHYGLMTLTMDAMLNYPGNSMMNFMDFIFGAGISTTAKRSAAASYEHNQKSAKESTDAMETEKLITLLRNDPIVGEPLGRVESLLESVLSEPMES